MLVVGLACATAGAVAHLALNIGGLLTGLASLACMIGLMSTSPADVTKRSALFAGFTGLKGASLGPLIGAVLLVDPSIVATAALGTTLIFACFSAVALRSPRRSYLYLGGFLLSALSCLALVGLVNLFLGIEALLSVQLYGGLLMFCGFVIFDTQVIVEKAAAGETDYVWHAVELFIDFVAIFVRLLIILSRNRKSERKERRRSDL